MVMVDEDFIATGSNDKSVKIWRIQSNQLIKDIQFKSDVTALSTLLRTDGSSLILVGLYKQFAVLNQSFEIMKVLDGQHNDILN